MQKKSCNRGFFKTSVFGKAFLKTKILFILLPALFLLCCKTQPQTAETLKIIEPEFEVVSILILQADIVVTEFEATLRIKNPNEFAVELKELSYELYGNGILWASGIGSDFLHIPSFESIEKKFTFEMNFINTSRRLLDDVIARRQVNYRFRGQAQVQPVIPRTEPFRISYYCSGYSEVRPKAER
jgi:LEA14-like dessication related protein